MFHPFSIYLTSPAELQLFSSLSHSLSFKTKFFLSFNARAIHECIIQLSLLCKWNYTLFSISVVCFGRLWPLHRYISPSTWSSRAQPAQSAHMGARRASPSRPRRLWLCVASAVHSRRKRDIGKVNEFIQHRSSIDTRVSMLLHSERLEEWRAKFNPIQNPMMMMMLKFIRLFFILSTTLCSALNSFTTTSLHSMLLALWSLLDASGGHKIDIKSRFSLSHSEVIYTRNSNKRRKKNFMRFLQLLFIVNELELMDRVLFSRLSLFTPPRRRRFSLSHRQCSAIHFFCVLRYQYFKAENCLWTGLTLFCFARLHISFRPRRVLCAMPDRDEAQQNRTMRPARGEERENINTEISPPFCVLALAWKVVEMFSSLTFFFRLS